MRGKWVRLSLPRRIVSDLMYFSEDVPLVAIERELALGDVSSVRASHPERPPWNTLLAKAFALVAAETPALRRAYVRLPWPHLYEYERSVAILTVERSYDGEPGVAFVHVTDPASCPLGHIAQMVREGTKPSFARNRKFRWMLRVAALPLLLRRMVWWLLINLPRARAQYFGTYAVSTVSSLGADVLAARSVVAMVLTYDAVRSDGSLVVSAFFDHRVLDGMTVARALQRLEQVMTGPIADELRTGASVRA